MDSGAVELYRKYRPKKFFEVIGQEEAVNILANMGREGKVPHCILFSGPSGVGKTTLARILKGKLGCSDIDCVEVNAAETRGIDLPREIEDRMWLAPMNGKVRVWIIDECHRLTGDAQSAFLKILEDTPSHVYFFLCTTDPQRLLPTIRGRAHEVKLRSLEVDELVVVMNRVLESEGRVLSDEVKTRIARAAQGSARKVLVLLGAVLASGKEDGLEDVLGSADVEYQAVEVARVLLKDRVTWAEVAKILNGIKDLDDQVETVRWVVLGYMKKVILGGGKKAGRAADVLAAFQKNWYDSKSAGLVLACYDLVAGTKE